LASNTLGWLLEVNMLVSELLQILSSAPKNLEVVLNVEISSELPPMYVELYAEDLIINIDRGLLEIMQDAFQDSVQDELEALIDSDHVFSPNEVLFLSRKLPTKSLDERMAEHNMSIAK